VSDDSGFGWFTKKDTTTGESDGAAPKPAPAPVKKNVWNEKIEEPDFDTEGMSLEEIETECSVKKRRQKKPNLLHHSPGQRLLLRNL